MRILLLLAFATSLSAGETVPLGHPDFYPSPDRPIGWRGDGTGAWPGANCVSSWNAQTGDNIVWKTDTPGAGLCQPVVAGEKVFITADPNLLLCYSVHDGKLLWQAAIDHTLKMSPEDQQKARAEQAYFDELWKRQQRWRQGFAALLDAVAEKQGIVEPPAPAAPNDRTYKTKRDEWSRARGELIRRIRKGGGGNDPALLPKPEEPEGVALVKAIGSDAQLKSRYEALLAEQDEYGWRDLYGNNGTMYAKDKAPAWMTRYRAAQEKYDIWFTTGNNWIAWTTYSFATPITDGKYIYVATANNAVAAVDFDGKIAWLVWEHLPGPKDVLHTAYTASPNLMDGKLVVNHRGHMRVYEAATGKKLWEVIDPYATLAAGDRKGKPRNYLSRSPEGTSPNVTCLRLPDGSPLPVVLDGFRLVWRLADGHLLTDQMPTHNKGNTAIVNDDIYMYVTGGDRKPEFCGGALRLKAVSRDKVEVEWLWKEPDEMCHSTTPVFLDGRFVAQFGGRTPAYAHDKVTGKKETLFGNAGIQNTNCSPIVAGRRMYSFGPHGSPAMNCQVGDLDAKTVTLVSTAATDDRFLGKDEFGLVNWKIPSGYQQNSSPSAQANRIFFRARGVLWCIGDPKQPFPVPRDCPAEARINK